jgi:outer membrane lipoprotein LolB
MVRRSILLACLVSLVSGCTTTPSRSTDPAAELAYQQRADLLLAMGEWRLSGKLAASNGKDGGSGNFSWQKTGDVTFMSFRGALGKGAWELEAREGFAALRLADGRTYSAGSVAQLVSSHLQVKIPVDALSWWVLGLARPNGWEDRELDEAGRITYLQQFGWKVDFSAYREQQQVWLPGKLVARNRENTIKLVISDWAVAPQVSALD